MESVKTKSLFVLHPDKNQMKDAGMAFTLIFLLIGIATGGKIWLTVTVLLLLIDMTYTKFFFYPAVFWFTLSNMLGAVASRVLLSLIFFVVVTPMGAIRKMLRSDKGDGKYDSMKIKMWKQSNASVFKNRSHKFEKKDIINPY